MIQRSGFLMLAIALAMLGLPASAAAQSTCSNFGTVSIDGGSYIYQNNEWNSGLEQCATVNGLGFSLTTANFNSGTQWRPGNLLFHLQGMPLGQLHYFEPVSDRGKQYCLGEYERHHQPAFRV
jgi:hypothetical protein